MHSQFIQQSNTENNSIFSQHLEQNVLKKRFWLHLLMKPKMEVCGQTGLLTGIGLTIHHICVALKM